MKNKTRYSHARCRRSSSSLLLLLPSITATNETNPGTNTENNANKWINKYNTKVIRKQGEKSQERKPNGKSFRAWDYKFEQVKQCSKGMECGVELFFYFVRISTMRARKSRFTHLDNDRIWRSMRDQIHSLSACGHLYAWRLFFYPLLIHQLLAATAVAHFYVIYFVLFPIYLYIFHIFRSFSIAHWTVIMIVCLFVCLVLLEATIVVSKACIKNICYCYYYSFLLMA